MGVKDTNPFVIKVGANWEIMSFNSFFEMNSDGDIVENIGVLHSFLKNVGVVPKFKEDIVKPPHVTTPDEL
jgi:hypothetical protein